MVTGVSAVLRKEHINRAIVRNLIYSAIWNALHVPIFKKPG